MKRTALFSALATAAFVAQAQGPAFVDRARVQSVEPQYETVQVPRNECSSQWVDEARPVSGGHGIGGAIVGGTAGAIVGAQVGKGSGRDASIAAGAVIGAIAGDRIANRDGVAYEQSQREVRTCRTVYETQTRINGYRVTYEYRGHQSSMVMREQPGNTVPVRVSVTPLEERESARY